MPAAFESSALGSDGFIDPLNHSALVSYREAVRARYGLISFVGLPAGSEEAARDVPLERLFVAPNVSENYLLPESFDDPLQPPPTRAIADVLEQHPRLVLLGDPGAGKTTLVNWIALSFCQVSGSGLLERKLKRAYVPLVLVLRELILPAKLSWRTLLAAFLDTPTAAVFKRNPELLKELLDIGQAFLILDGYDELGDKTRREAIREALWEGWTRYPHCRWLITSRVVGYKEAFLDKLEIHESKQLAADRDRISDAPKLGLEVEQEPTKEGPLLRVRYAALRYLAPMDDAQIRQFSQLWWRHNSGDPRFSSPDPFLTSLRASPGPRTLGRNPTLLTLCCFFFRSEGGLPDGRFLLYQKICVAYLRTIEKVRRVAMQADDFKYSLEEQMGWLAEIAFYMLTSEPREGAQARARSNSNCLLYTGEEWLAKLASVIQPRPGDRAWEVAENFFEYLHRRSGLVAELGLSDQKKATNTPLYAFVHPSFQEFFAGLHLTFLWTDPDWLHSPDNSEHLAGSPNWFERVARQSQAREMFVFAWEGASRIHPKYPQRILERLLGKLLDWGGDPTEWKEFQPPAPAGPPSPDEQTSFVEVFAALANNPYVSFDGAIKLDGKVREALLARCWRFQLKAYRIHEMDRRHPGNYLGVANLLLARPDKNEIAIRLLEEQLQMHDFLKLEQLSFSHCTGLTRLPKLPPKSIVDQVTAYKCPALSEAKVEEFIKWCREKRGIEVEVLWDGLHVPLPSRERELT